MRCVVVLLGSSMVPGASSMRSMIFGASSTRSALLSATQRNEALALRRGHAYLQEEEGAAHAHWVKGVLASNGNDYWWLYDPYAEEDADSEVELEAPNRAWRVGELPSGQDYIWRYASDDEEEEEIETMIWTEKELSTGAPYWLADDGTVSITNPFDVSIVQQWTDPDPEDEDEEEEDGDGEEVELVAD